MCDNAGLLPVQCPLKKRRERLLAPDLQGLSKCTRQQSTGRDRGLGRELGLGLIWVESRHWGEEGAETQGKIKTGAGAGELRPPSLRVLLHIYNEKWRRGGLVFAPRHTLD